MRRLLILTLACCLIVTVLDMAAIDIGRAQPTPEVLNKYHVTLCGETLCFEGIKSGVTSWVDAEAAVGRDRTDNSPYQLYFPLDGGARVLVFKNDYITVDAITLDLFSSEGRPTLGAVLATYGPPCKIITSDGTFESADYVELIYPFFYISSRGLDFSVSISDAGSSDTDQCSTSLQLVTALSYSRWHGIRSIGYYKLHTEFTGSFPP